MNFLLMIIIDGQSKSGGYYSTVTEAFLEGVNRKRLYPHIQDFRIKNIKTGVVYESGV